MKIRFKLMVLNNKIDLNRIIGNWISIKTSILTFKNILKKEFGYFQDEEYMNKYIKDNTARKKINWLLDDIYRVLNLYIKSFYQYKFTDEIALDVMKQKVGEETKNTSDKDNLERNVTQKFINFENKNKKDEIYNSETISDQKVQFDANLKNMQLKYNKSVSVRSAVFNNKRVERSETEAKYKDENNLTSNLGVDKRNNTERPQNTLGEAIVKSDISFQETDENNSTLMPRASKSTSSNQSDNFNNINENIVIHNMVLIPIDYTIENPSLTATNIIRDTD